MGTKFFLLILTSVLYFNNIGAKDNSAVETYFPYHPINYEKMNFKHTPMKKKGRDLKINVKLGQFNKPKHVVYKEPEMNYFAEKTADTLDFIVSDELKLDVFSEQVLIGPYLSKQMLLHNFGKDHKILEGIVPVNIDKVQYEVKELILRDEQSKASFGNFFKNQFPDNTICKVRYPTYTELEWYWSVISYDIIGAAFVLETPTRNFFIHFYGNQIIYIEDFKQLNFR